MKLFYSLLSLFMCLTSFGQNNLIKNFVSEVFLGYDCTIKPSKIESRSYRPFDYGDSYDEKNIIKFTSHPLVKGNVDGQYNVNYFNITADLFEKYGIYQLDMTLRFKNYKSCKETLEKLKRLARKNAEKKSEIKKHPNPEYGEECIYRYDEKLQLPRIYLDYSRAPYQIRIRVYTTYDFNMYKKYKDKIW
ncbi:MULTISPECIES: hypothetical protein [Flavobacterium]|uniref:Uncharacterized protein n=1 Tax=Flavobacterium jumunjinense TaxID=998845 RepID=A0ABV5GP86_9FLAO|nr:MULTISPECIES: hypothetical protein [Flavobacterium]